MNDKDIYYISSRYENLIRNAYNCPRGMKNGADLSFMQNAITMEEGKTYAKHLGSFEKQFEKVKNYTIKALVKLAKTKPYSTEADFFNTLKNRIEFSDTTSELVDIINLSVDKIIEIKK